MASFSERYHEFTKYNPLSIDRLHQVNWADEPRPFKSHDSSADFDFTPWLQHLANLNKEDSQVNFGPDSGNFVSDPEFLASLFFHSAGISAAMQTEKGPFYFRANPSAGGLYPNESYIYLLKETSQLKEERLLTHQFYHYQPLSNQLYATGDTSQSSHLEKCFALPDEYEEADFLIVITGIHARSFWRYGQRAYRRQLLDCGHLAGNYELYLKSKGKHVKFLNGFSDINLQQKMGLKMEAPLLVLAVKNTAFGHESNNSHGNDTVRSTPSLHFGSIPPQDAYKNINTSADIYIQQAEMEAQLDPTPANIHIQKPLHSSMEITPLAKNKLQHMTFVPLELIRRRSVRQFSTRLGAQASFEKFSEIVDFSLELHPKPMSAGFLKTWLLFKGDSESPMALYTLDLDGKLWLKEEKTPTWEKFTEVCLGQDIAAQSQAVIFHTANLNEATKALGDRVYRYLNYDAGVYGQLMQIAANHMKLGTTGIGGYFDDMVNELLSTELSEAIFYITLLGTPPD